jgi:hypothetical protein
MMRETPSASPALSTEPAPSARSWRRPLRLGALVPLALYAIARLRDPAWWDILDDLNLAVHEAGHIVFSPFGDQMTALGGSLFQLLVPLAFVVHFARSRQRWAAGVTLAWVAVNCINVGRYAADARAQDLPLLGGENVIHDWWFVLVNWDLLTWDAGIGRAFHALAALLFASSLACGILFVADGEETPAAYGGAATERGPR